MFCFLIHFLMLGLSASAYGQGSSGSQVYSNFNELIHQYPMSKRDQLSLRVWLEKQYAGVDLNSLQCSFSVTEHSGSLPQQTEERFYFRRERKLAEVTTPGPSSSSRGREAGEVAGLADIVERTRLAQSLLLKIGEEFSEIHLNPRLLVGLGIDSSPDLAAQKTIAALKSVIQSQLGVKFIVEDPLIIQGVPDPETTCVRETRKLPRSMLEAYYAIALRGPCVTTQAQAPAPQASPLTAAPLPIHLVWNGKGINSRAQSTVERAGSDLTALVSSGWIDRVLSDIAKFQYDPELPKAVSDMEKKGYSIQLIVEFNKSELELKSYKTIPSIWFGYETYFRVSSATNGSFLFDRAVMPSKFYFLKSPVANESPEAIEKERLQLIKDEKMLEFSPAAHLKVLKEL